MLPHKESELDASVIMNVQHVTSVQSNPKLTSAGVRYFGNSKKKEKNTPNQEEGAVDVTVKSRSEQ